VNPSPMVRTCLSSKIGIAARYRHSVGALLMIFVRGNFG